MPELRRRRSSRWPGGTGWASADHSARKGSAGGERGNVELPFNTNTFSSAARDDIDVKRVPLIGICRFVGPKHHFLALIFTL